MTEPTKHVCPYGGTVGGWESDPACGTCGGLCDRCQQAASTEQTRLLREAVIALSMTIAESTSDQGERADARQRELFAYMRQVEVGRVAAYRRVTQESLKPAAGPANWSAWNPLEVMEQIALDLSRAKESAVAQRHHATAGALDWVRRTIRDWLAEEGKATAHVEEAMRPKHTHDAQESLDAEALDQAIQALVHRLDALEAAIRQLRGEPTRHGETGGPT